MQEIPKASKLRTAGLAHAMKLEILFRDITATRKGSWTPYVGLIGS
jgi:hypothetical protein